tara:strand:+ start:23078 stop:24088 length:1011 start_codon:yes stop_codon:yes gene_type:complete
MTWRKRQEHVMDGDIVEPSEWRINQNEFASEFNGYLDNDNLHNHTLNRRLVKRDTFTKVYVDQKQSLYGYLFNHTQSGWTSQADFLVKQSGYPPSEWFGIAGRQNELIGENWTSHTSKETFTGWKTVENTEDPSKVLFYERGKESSRYTTELPHRDFVTDSEAMIIVDFHGTVSWMHGIGSMHNENDVFFNHLYRIHDSGTYLGEDYPIRTTSGNGFHKPENYYYEYRAARTLCSMWRITVDGMIVAETGLLGSEYQHHPIYLCGAIPVSSGSHRVQLEAQMVWYSPGLDKTIQSSAEYPALSKIDETTPDDGYRINLTTDCELRWPNLITQVRSR